MLGSMDLKERYCGLERERERERERGGGGLEHSWTTASYCFLFMHLVPAVC